MARTQLRAQKHCFGRVSAFRGRATFSARVPGPESAAIFASHWSIKSNSCRETMANGDVRWPISAPRLPAVGTVTIT
jgi:hypothetical protein